MRPPSTRRPTSRHRNRSTERSAQAAQDSAADTSWQPVSSWYKKQVGEAGHYFHQKVVLPKVRALLKLQPKSSVLDLACGQGVLARQLGSEQEYLGIDAASDLIREAKKLSTRPRHHFKTSDVTQPLGLTPRFTHATIILALQNLKQPAGAIANAAAGLLPFGVLVLVINHPCFRIPRQSSWGIDERNKTQYRRVDRYLSPLKVPITAHPGKHQSSITWSFHEPLSAYTAMLAQHGFLIETIEEWTSDKESQGSAAKMENRSRAEFPLFMAIKAIKAR